MSKATKHARKARLAAGACRVNTADDEMAHAYEDDAYIHALKAIAAGYHDPEELAKNVLELRKLAFSRWYA